MNLLRTLSTFVFCAFFIVKVSGIQILNHSLYPPNPTCHDEVSYSINVMASTSGCEPLDIDSSFQNNVFDFSVRHENGMLQVICERTDTYALGQLPPGTYTVEHYVYQTGGGSDLVVFTFEVTGTDCDLPEPEPEAVFDVAQFSTLSACAGEQLQFEALVEGFEPGNTFDFNLLDVQTGYTFNLSFQILSTDSLWTFEIDVPAQLPSGTYILQTISDAPAETFNDSHLLEINTLPATPEWLNLNQTACADEESIVLEWSGWAEADSVHLLTESMDFIASYEITDGEVQITPESGFSGNVAFVLLLENNCGFSANSDTAYLEIHPLPHAEIVQNIDWNYFAIGEGSAQWYLDGVLLETLTDSVINLYPFLPSEFDSLMLTLSIESDEGCISSDSMVIYAPVGMQETVSDKEFFIYEKDGRLNIRQHTTQRIEKVSLFDLSGRLILQKQGSVIKNELIQLQTLHLPRGLFLVKINMHDGSVITEKVITGR